MVAGQTPLSAAHFVKPRKTAWIVLLVSALALVFAGVLIARNWPFSEAKVTQSLQEDFPATVTFQKFPSTFFPHPAALVRASLSGGLAAPPTRLPS